LRPGFLIQAIDGIPVEQIERDVRRDRPPYNDRGRRAQITKGILSRIYGAPGIEVGISFTDERGANGEKKMTRAKRSGAASELFAASLQAAKRAVVVGRRSPGSVMESDNKIFMNGAVLMYPVAQLSTPDHTVLEGYGVVPNIEIELDRGKLLKGIDSQLDAALQYLRDERQKKPGLPMKK